MPKKALRLSLKRILTKKTDFYKDIGYEAEISEEKATEAMGETDEIAEQFGELHNDFYNPAGGIILTVLFCAMLGGVYFLLKNMRSRTAFSLRFPSVQSAFRLHL